MKVLVTGAFGNVGSHVVRHLETRGYDVVGVDLKTPATLQKADVLKAELGIRVAWADITDRSAVDELFFDQKPDAVVHLAAVIAPIAYRIPDVAYRVNVEGTRNLVAAADACGDTRRFVFTSSYSVHGPRNPYRDLPPITSSTPVNPKDNYGCHKVEGERIVREGKTPWVIVRLPAVWSTDPGFGRAPEFMEFGFLLPQDRNEHVIDARDAALALANAVDRDVAGRTFIVGGGEGWSGVARELYARLFVARGLLPMPDTAYRVADPDVDDSWYYEDLVDTSESEYALEYQQHSIEDYFAVVAPKGVARFLMPLIRGVVVRRLARSSPYFGRPVVKDSQEIWYRICEKWDVDREARYCGSTPQPVTNSLQPDERGRK